MIFSKFYRLVKSPRDDSIHLTHFFPIFFFTKKEEITKKLFRPTKWAMLVLMFLIQDLKDYDSLTFQ